MINKKTLKPLTFGLGLCLLPLSEAKAVYDDWPFPKAFFKEFNAPFFKETGLYSNIISDISETDKNLKISFDVPGLSKEDINVHLKDHNVLVVDGKKEVNKKKDKKGQHQSEYSSRSFYQAVKLPDTADTNKIDAEVKNGVLTVIIPKKPDSPSKDKKITVR